MEINPKSTRPIANVTSYEIRVGGKLRKTIILPDIKFSPYLMPPIELPNIACSKILNDKGKEIEIRGWQGGRWNFDYGFTAEVFEAAIRKYFLDKNPNIDAIQINNIIPGMGAVSRALKKGETERCLFIPEKVLEQDPGLNGLNDDASHFTSTSVEPSHLMSRDKLSELLNMVQNPHRFSAATRARMQKAMEMRYGITKAGESYALKDIGRILSSKTQWIFSLILRAEKLLGSFPPAQARIEALQHIFSAVISYLVQEKKSISLDEIKQALIDLKLIQKEESDLVPAWLSLVDRFSQGGIRFLNQAEIFSENRLSADSRAGAGLIYINRAKNKTKYFIPTTVKINLDQPTVPAAEEIASLLREHGPLNFKDIARLRGTSINTIQQQLQGNKKFVLVGRGKFDLVEKHPGIHDVPFPKTSRRSYCFAAVYLLLAGEKRSFSINDIYKKMTDQKFYWSKRAIENVLTDDRDHRVFFNNMKGRFSVKAASA